MENFDYFQEALDKSLHFKGNWSHHEFVILAKRGDLYAWQNENRWYGGKSIPFGSDKERKKESDRMINADVLVYDKITQSLDWKSVYKNSIGFYFRKRTAIYIQKHENI